MNRENMCGGFEDVTISARIIIGEYERFIYRMSRHISGFDPDFLKDHIQLREALLLLCFSFSSVTYQAIEMIVRELKLIFSKEFDLCEVYELYEYADSIFRDFLKNNGYNVEDFYETQKDAEET